MELIMAMTTDGLIGDGNNLAYKIKEDMQWFKEKTMGKICVMGRKTYESLPKAKLPGREIVIISRDANYKGVNNERVLTTLNEVFALKGDIMICGGKEIYEYFKDKVDTRYVTIINDSEGKSFEDPVQVNKWDYLGRSNSMQVEQFKQINEELSVTMYSIPKEMYK